MKKTFLCEIHDFLRFRMNCYCSGHGSRRSVFRTTTLMRTLGAKISKKNYIHVNTTDRHRNITFSHSIPVMFFFHQVIPRTECNKMSVIGRSRYGHGPRASHVGMTQLISQTLKFIRIETIIVPQNVIVTRSRCSLRRKKKINE